MARKFNTTGSCRPAYDYMLPPLRRLPAVRELIDEQSYFVLHAPGHTGITTAILTLARTLVEEGRYSGPLRGDRSPLH